MMTVSGFASGSGQSQSQAVSDLIKSFTNISDRQTALASTFKANTASLTDLTTGKQPKRGTSDRYYQRKEPTVLFGNVKSGWANDFSDTLQVLLENQVLSGADPNSSDTQWPNYVTYLSGNINVEGRQLDKGILGLFIPRELMSGALALSKEFYLLRTSSSSPILGMPSPQVISWFHDKATIVQTESRGRDRWQDTQPWKPLFIE